MPTYSFSSLAFFGDSLTDQGGLFDLTSQVLDIPIPPANAGYDNKFTNGDVYAQVMAELIGISDVDNYALGSARALGSRSVEEVIDDAGLTDYLVANPSQGILNTNISLNGQLNRFASSGPVAPGTAAVVNIGSNDYGNFEPFSVITAIFEAVALANNVVDKNIEAAETLLAAGVDTVILNLLPVADFFPAFQTLSGIERDIGEAILEQHNDGLRDGAADLRAGGADVRIVDIEFMSAEVQLDQTTFGLLAPLTEAKLLTSGGELTVVDGQIVIPENPAVAGFDDDQIAFWDLVHPSAALHGVLGAFQAASLGYKTILGTRSADVYATGNKDDFIMSSNGADTINTAKGADIVFAGRGSDDVQGRNGNDLISGGSGLDKLQGQRGADVLAGGIGNDELRGGAQNDVLIDGRGNDIANGGSGDDIFIYIEGSLIGGTTGGDFDVLSGASGNDTLYLVLSEATRAIVEAEVQANRRFQDLDDAINIDINSIENIVFLDDRAELADITADARIEEADLWGLF